MVILPSLSRRKVHTEGRWQNANVVLSHLGLPERGLEIKEAFRSLQIRFGELFMCNCLDGSVVWEKGHLYGLWLNESMSV